MERRLVPLSVRESSPKADCIRGDYLGDGMGHGAFLCLPRDGFVELSCFTYSTLKGRKNKIMQDFFRFKNGPFLPHLFVTSFLNFLQAGSD